MIIGQPKSLEEFRTLSAPELIGFFQSIEQQATSGIDMRMPVAMPINDCARLAVTMRRYHKVAFELDALLAGIESEEEPLEKYEALVLKLRDLLHIEPPEPPKIVQPGGHIITP